MKYKLNYTERMALVRILPDGLDVASMRLPARVAKAIEPTLDELEAIGMDGRGYIPPRNMARTVEVELDDDAAQLVRDSLHRADLAKLITRVLLPVYDMFVVPAARK
jgi:hypothetical protein